MGITLPLQGGLHVHRKAGDAALLKVVRALLDAVFATLTASIIWRASGFLALALPLHLFEFFLLPLSRGLQLFGSCLRGLRIVSSQKHLWTSCSHFQLHVL